MQNIKLNFNLLYQKFGSIQEVNSLLKQVKERKTMSEDKKRYSLKDYEEEIEQIRTATIQIENAVVNMPDCTAKKAFQNSVENLNTKIEKFTTSKKIVMTDEQKAAVKAFLAGEATFTPIEKEEDEVSTIEEPVKKSKKNK